jgi:hypothetical protein
MGIHYAQESENDTKFLQDNGFQTMGITLNCARIPNGVRQWRSNVHHQTSADTGAARRSFSGFLSA